MLHSTPRANTQGHKVHLQYLLRENRCRVLRGAALRSDGRSAIGPGYPTTSVLSRPCDPCPRSPTDIMPSQNFELPVQSQQRPQQEFKMPPAAIDDYSRPVTPEQPGRPNGLSSPRTPKQAGLSLTEYTANPSPPSEDQKSKAQNAIPEAFLLPNGYPDVRVAPLKTHRPVRGNQF